MRCAPRSPPIPGTCELTDRARTHRAPSSSTGRHAGAAGSARLSHRGGLAARDPGQRLALASRRLHGDAGDHRSARRFELRLEPRAEGVIALEARSPARSTGRGGRDRLRGARRRALPRLRRALQRRRPARQRGRELRLRRPLPGRGVPADQPLHADLGPARRPLRRDLLPGPVAAVDRRLRRARRQPADQLLPPRAPTTPRPGASRSSRRPAGEPGARAAARRRRSVAALLRRPEPADALRRFTEATGRQPKPAAPWAARALVSGRRRRARRDRPAAGGRRAALRRCRPTPTTCRAATRSGTDRGRSASPQRTRPGSRSPPTSTR